MPRYKYSQETGEDFKVNTEDHCDAMEDTNELRQILNDLGELLAHSKLDDSYPKDGTSGGYLGKLNLGFDANKPVSPAVGDMYLATDTIKIYRCFTVENWTQVYPAVGGFSEQVLTSGTEISWNLENGNKAILTAEHDFTITISNPDGAMEARLILTQDATGGRLMDEIITQNDDSIATADVHVDTNIIDVGIDIPTGAIIRFKTSAADLPDPLVVDEPYYAIRVSATEIKVAATQEDAISGTAIDIIDAGTGTHEVQQLVKWFWDPPSYFPTYPGAEILMELFFKASDAQWYGRASYSY